MSIIYISSIKTIHIGEDYGTVQVNYSSKSTDKWSHADEYEVPKGLAMALLEKHEQDNPQEAQQ